MKRYSKKRSFRKSRKHGRGRRSKPLRGYNLVSRGGTRL